ncbi:protamine-like protein 99C [Drosophila subpulchrella]|uniref:protamine-like protein 99C n=1 Tax=Drosophila subpulchrella TaxID=1486046 RepID=UPI0018A195EF|nr:protamine-like protein 99C [Drosophila subpulchrella]
MDGKKGGNTLRKTTGSLNLSSQYKKRFYGISPQNGIRFGAREWNYMTLFKNSKETMTVIKSAPQEFESQSHRESPGKSELEKRDPVRSPYARERESRKKKERKISKSIKRLVKKKPSPVLKIRHKSPLGSAVAYIHYMRKFQSLNSHLSGPELLNKAARVWCVLTESQRKQFDLNLKVYKRSNGFNFLKIV